MKKTLIIFLLSFLSINCILKNKEDLNLVLNGIDTPTIGKKGTILVELVQKDQPYWRIKDFSKEIIIQAKISEDNDKKIYRVDCGIWCGKYFDNTVNIFCNLNETIPAGNYTLLLSEIKSFDYKDFRVNIDVNDQEKYLKFQKFDMNIIDLYSDEQSITLEEGKENYEAKFNIVSYNQEKIHFNFIFIVDNCKAQNDILICPLTKSDILKYIYPGKTEFSSTWYLNPVSRKIDVLNFVPSIKVVVPDMQKKDIFVGIKKLLVNANGKGAPIAYETNITEVSNYYNFDNYDNVFDLTFINKNRDGIETETDNKCRFLKYDNNPLLLVCFIDMEGTNWLKEITQEKILENLSYKYIYRLQPFKSEEKIETFGAGSQIYWFYPKTLDFTKNNDTLSFDVGIKQPKDYTGVSFIEGEEDLKCEEYGFRIIKCLVPKTHFKGKKSGEYFIKRNNIHGKKYASYEVPPVKVILPDKGTIISSSLFYSLLLFLIMM